MAVITRFIIVRNGIELDKVFDDKKEADAYDKMLDAAENLAAFIKQGELRLDLDDKTVDEISIYLAQNALQVTQILKGIKPLPAAGSPASTGAEETTDRVTPVEEKEEKKARGRTASTKPKAS